MIDYFMMVYFLSMYRAGSLRAVAEEISKCVSFIDYLMMQ
jgi:hypothetical protein